jgi:hypothetical protein
LALSGTACSSLAASFASARISSACAESGTTCARPAFVISLERVQTRYEYLDEKRHSLEAWGHYLENLIAPPGANIVALRAVR